MKEGLLESINSALEKLKELKVLRTPLTDSDIKNFESLEVSLNKRKEMLVNENLKEIQLEDIQRELSIINYFLGNELMFLRK